MGKQQGLTVHYELEWSALFLFLFMFLTGDVASDYSFSAEFGIAPVPRRLFLAAQQRIAVT